MKILETVKEMAGMMVDAIRDYFEEETTTSRRKVIATCTLCTLLGIVLGFLVAPIKKGFYFNISNNGNSIGMDNDEEDYEDWE